MSQSIHTFSLKLTMKLMNEISKIDRFDASWSIVEKREGQTLKQLKSIATVRSVGASTRIEGSKMTDAEVEVLIDKLKVSKLEERDEQEVAGYFDTFDTISESYKDIDISQGSLQNLHKILMKYCDKDEWHKGGYKKHSNAVEANHANGFKQIIFKTAEPGFETENAMKKLMDWYYSDNDTLPIVKIAIFIYDFLSIHPFQDGNGRLSRLLTSLLLLKQGYSWIQYVSFEHEIENRKAEYYKVLMQTQKQRPNEKIDEWVVFFLDCLLNLQNQLTEKLQTQQNLTKHFAPREKNIIAFIENHPGSKSSEIADRLAIPLSTVKKLLTSMVTNKVILKYGVGAGTNYLVESINPIKKDLVFTLTNTNKKKEFLLMSINSFVEIKKIMLTPLFNWTLPLEWQNKLVNKKNNLTVTIKSNQNHVYSTQDFLVFSKEATLHPNFTLKTPIHIPSILSKKFKSYDYPLQVEIELTNNGQSFEFDFMFIYDEL